MNNYFCKILLYSFLLVLTFSCHSPWEKDKQSVFVRIADQPSLIQKDTLYSRLYHSVVFEQNYEKVDSIIADKIQEETLERNKKNVKSLYSDYFLLPDLKLNSPFAVRYAREAEDLLFSEHDYHTDWNLIYALFTYYWEVKNGSKCMEFASRLQELSSRLQKPETSAIASLALGEAHELNNNYKLAISNLFDALSWISHSERKDVHIYVLSSLSRFYFNHVMFKNALDYKYKEIELYNPKNLIDSILYFRVALEYQDLILISSNNQLFEIQNTIDIIQFAKKNQCQSLYEYATAFLRTTLMITNRTKELKAYFKSMEKEELDKLKMDSPYIYYIFSAYVLEDDGQISDTRIAYEKAILELDSSQEQENRKSFAHLQFAQFLLRRGDHKYAEIHFKDAVDFARIAKNDAFEINASKAAEQYFTKIKNYEKAHYYLTNYHKLLETKSITSKDQDVFKIEIETEQKILEENKKLEELYQEKLHQGQYNLIAIICIMVMMILLISVRFKVPIWFIRVLGYMGVIFIFEFSIIQIDNIIHDVTHHTPWKIFTIKVVLISVLLPFHHLIEKRLIKFLISRRMADGNLFSFNFSYIKNWFKKLDEPDDSH